MNKKSTLIAASAALIAIVGFGSAALANDLETNASAAQIAREARGNPLPWWWNSQDKAAGSYAYQPVQAPHAKVSAPKK
jgi:nitrate reductase cytochrome c-type subunit